MKFVWMIACAVILFLPVLGSATTLTFTTHASPTNTATDSISASLTNGGAQLAVNVIVPNSAWSTIPGVPWVSPYQTGDQNAPGFVEEPNGTNFWFTQTIYIPIGFHMSSATLIFGADDTANVWVNGVQLLYSSNSQAVNCSAMVPGCKTNTFFNGDIKTLLQPGENVLLSQNIQTGRYSLGITDSLTIVGEQDRSVPKPLTSAMVGLGLFGLGLVRRHRRS